MFLRLRWAESELRRLERRVLEFERELAEKQKLFDQEIREAHERFSLFMNNLPGFVWMKDIEGRYLYANQMVTTHLEPFRRHIRRTFGHTT